ncbi:unnamed protein product [Ilex paraguariensis]|uniref:Uncharacterized protein n=1 Tax=Ilex paraguariensis TaxID=185542 RepID=A0ABC8TT75_9AQUA
MQAERTEESESRRRRMMEERSFGRNGEMELPWDSERREIRRRHCLRTADLSAESVAEIAERKGERVSGERVLTIDSSSTAAAEWVSRSESLWRQVRTRCLSSRVEAAWFCLESDIVVERLRMMMVVANGQYQADFGGGEVDISSNIAGLERRRRWFSFSCGSLTHMRTLFSLHLSAL